jgi:hypothetical protein
MRSFWQWLKDPGLEHQALKRRAPNHHAHPQVYTPIVGIAEEAYLRMACQRSPSRCSAVVTFLRDSACKFTYPDGKTEDIRGKTGETLWLDAFEHLPENVSVQPFEAIFVEPKG